MLHRAFLLFCFTCFVPFARADLKWDATEIETAGDAEKPTAEFICTNTGSQPVQIISAVPGCECVSTKFDPAPIAPGGKSKVTAVFDPGQRSGKQKLDIAIWTDLPDEISIVLQWNVLLPDVLELKPSALIWKEGEDKETRTVEVTFPNAPETKVLKVACEDPAFQIATEGNRVTVRVTGTPTADISVLSATTDSKLPRLREIKIPMAFGAIPRD